MKTMYRCPHCQKPIERYKNPVPTVDIIIETQGGIVLIERKNPPYGWALPGGFIDYGESAEAAAVREAREETGMQVTLKGLLGVYSKPDRDPRFHTITTVFFGQGRGVPAADDDAKSIGVFREESLPVKMAFDHKKIVIDYYRNRRNNGK